MSQHLNKNKKNQKDFGIFQVLAKIKQLKMNLLIARNQIKNNKRNEKLNL